MAAGGVQCISMTTGPLTREQQLWAAVFEAGPRAFLDGASALEAAGLQRFASTRIRVSVPRGARVRRAKVSTSVRPDGGKRTTSWAAECLVPARRSPLSAPPCGRDPTGKRH